MNSPNLLRIGVNAAFALTVMCLVANAQISGTGTTGPTDGSGRGTGSAGVMTGTGPDVQPSVGAERPYRVGAQQSVTTTTIVRSKNASSTKKAPQNTRNRLKKTSRHPQATPTPRASASPR